MHRAVTTVAVGERFQPYLARLKKSVPPGVALHAWNTGWPPGSPAHGDMHYAFKVHAVKDLRNHGYEEVVWLDSATHFTGDTEPLWAEIVRRGVYIIASDGPNREKLGEWISDDALAYFNTSRDAAMEMALCGGCVVGLDLRNSKARLFLENWDRVSRTGLFMANHSEHCPDRMRSLLFTDGPNKRLVSLDTRVKGHRSDEACFSLMLRELNIEPVSLGEWNKYARTGYDL